jgi:hypothetical protein
VGCKPEVEGGGSRWLWNPLRSATAHRKLSTHGRKQQGRAQGRAQHYRPSAGDNEGIERERFRERGRKDAGTLKEENSGANFPSRDRGLCLRKSFFSAHHHSIQILHIQDMRIQNILSTAKAYWRPGFPSARFARPVVHIPPRRLISSVAAPN